MTRMVLPVHSHAQELAAHCEGPDSRANRETARRWHAKLEVVNTPRKVRAASAASQAIVAFGAKGASTPGGTTAVAGAPRQGGLFHLA